MKPFWYAGPMPQDAKTPLLLLLLIGIQLYIAIAVCLQRAAAGHRVTDKADL
jgi:hypothetical protein